jgi:transposase
MEALIQRESGSVPAPRKYPDEMRERARRMVAEAREQEPRLSINAACKRIGPQLGIQPDTLRNWCKQDDIDTGRAPGTTTTDAARIRELERENRELKRANEILKTASAFFAAAELDRRLR